MTLTDWLLLAILIMLIIDYLKDSVTAQKIRRNVPYWIREKVNELRNR